MLSFSLQTLVKSTLMSHKERAVGHKSFNFKRISSHSLCTSKNISELSDVFSLC